MDNQTVAVKYQTQISHCSCCNQKLPQKELSKIKEFQINKETAESWTDWNAAAQFPEDLESLVSEFIYETIRFFSVHSNEKIIIEDSEEDKVRQWILTVITA